MESYLDFYRGRRVLVTGHTGFKGSWLCHILSGLGADVAGYSRGTRREYSLYDIADIGDDVSRSYFGDVRDRPALMEAFGGFEPEVVLHLAAQPIVREGYRDPVSTYETNVMGTLNVLEAVRSCGSVGSVLNVTTDKVYLNREWVWGYREEDPLDGYDPYSNSKSCSELVTHCYSKSFFCDGVSVSTARAGNVIGGGDFSKDRIVPDCVRAALSHREIEVRNPRSVRPYQHVLEPLFAYLMIAAAQHGDKAAEGSYNVGPDDGDCLETGRLVDLFVEEWGEGVRWACRQDGGPHEANYLKLDCSKLKSTFGWRPRWDLGRAVAKTVEWSKCWRDGGDVRSCMDRQIKEYLES